MECLLRPSGQFAVQLNLANVTTAALAKVSPVGPSFSAGLDEGAAAPADRAWLRLGMGLLEDA